MNLVTLKARMAGTCLQSSEGLAYCMQSLCQACVALQLGELRLGPLGNIDEESRKEPLT